MVRLGNYGIIICWVFIFCVDFGKSNTTSAINSQMVQSKISRIAYGVPMGGELEYVDNTTLGRAIQGRRELN